MTTNLIVLAAGHGTRMQSDTPKVLHRLAGLELFAHALATGAALEPVASVLVVGAGADQVKDAAQEFDPEVKIAVQSPPQGTGDAVRCGLSALGDAGGDARRALCRYAVHSDRNLGAYGRRARRRERRGCAGVRGCGSRSLWAAGHGRGSVEPDCRI